MYSCVSQCCMKINSFIGEESRYAIQMNRYFLMPIGIWPVQSNAPLIMKILRYLTVVACYWLICFLLVPCALHTFLEEPNPAIKLKLIGPMSFCLMAISKYCSLVGRTKEIGACLEHVEEDWKLYSGMGAKVELDMMRKNATVGRFLAVLCAAFMYGGGFFYHTIMPLSSGRIATTDLTEKLLTLELQNHSGPIDLSHGPRALTYPIYRELLDVDNSPIYEIVFFIQCMSGFVLYTITIGACSLAAVFVVHVCAQLEIVMSMIQEFAENEISATHEKMAKIVQRHLRALKFATRVEENLNVICFVEFIGCTMNICFLGYYFITEWESRNTISTMTYSILLVSFTFNIFIFCYIGELLTEKCKKVGDVTYATNWYRLPCKKAANLILIIVISSCYPARITAGKMVYLSMNSFCNVIKTAATYLNLLRTVML